MTREQGPTRGAGAHAQQRIITEQAPQPVTAGNSYAEVVGSYIGLLGLVAGAPPDHLKPGSVIDSQNPTGDSTSLGGGVPWSSITPIHLTSEVRDA